MNINADTLCLGLIANPIGHSLSPQLHNAVFTRLGINAVYIPMAVQDAQLEQALYGLQSLGFRGVNVTIPFKERVVQYMDELSASAEDCGAVNVIHFKQGRIIGHNTDGQGLVKSLLQEGVDLQHKALVIGAGGAARSIVAALIRAGVGEIELFDIEARRAEDLARLMADRTAARISGYAMNEAHFLSSALSASLIINCSPVGMHPHISSTPISTLKGVATSTVVVDIIYNPEETRLLQLARQEGCKTINGLAMFVHQAALTLEILLGITPPAEYMKEVVRHCLKQ